MAANEMGVILCRTGHAAEVERFTRAIDSAKCHSVPQLGRCPQKLARGQAAANERNRNAWRRLTDQQRAIAAGWRAGFAGDGPRNATGRARYNHAEH
jgi:hypothetical protein